MGRRAGRLMGGGKYWGKGFRTSQNSSSLLLVPSEDFTGALVGAVVFAFLALGAEESSGATKPPSDS